MRGKGEWGKRGKGGQRKGGKGEGGKEERVDGIKVLGRN